MLHPRTIPASNPKVWVLIGTAVVGFAFLAEVRRRRLKAAMLRREDSGAFVEKFQILPPSQSTDQNLSGCTFAIDDIFDVKDHVTGFGNSIWRRHKVAQKMADVVATVLNSGATCVGKTIIGELPVGITGVTASSGSAMSVAAKDVDFALGMDTIGCVRVFAALCGIFGYRPSHGIISLDGAITTSPNLDTIGWFAHDASTLLRVGRALLKLSAVECRKVNRFVFADDLLQIYKVPMEKSDYVISTAIRNVCWSYTSQPPKHVDFGQYMASNVRSLEEFDAQSANQLEGTSAMEILSCLMASIQRYKFKPKLAHGVSDNFLAATNTAYENTELLSRVMSEIRNTMGSLLKDDEILVIPTVANPLSKFNAKKEHSGVFRDKTLIFTSIASLSGCCQVSIPLGELDGIAISVSLLAIHGADEFLLNSVGAISTSLQEQVQVVLNEPLLDIVGTMYTSGSWNEKGNAAFEEEEWSMAVKCFTEAIDLNGMNSAYYARRAEAYMQLASLPKAEEDWNKVISLDKKNAEAYLKRGLVREWMFRFNDALTDFKRVCILDPENKEANDGVARLRNRN